MSRDLPTGFSAAASAQTLAPVFLARLDWPTGIVRAWSGYGDITLSEYESGAYIDYTYTGLGTMGGISEVRETRDGAANGLTLTLGGINSADIALALNDESQGRSGKLYFGILSSAGTFTVDPYLIFDGVIDVCPIEDSGSTATISVKLEKELIDSRARGRRYTHEDQQIDHAGDLGFEYVAGLADKQITWGAVVAGAGAAAGSGVGSGGDDTSANYE